MDTIIELNSEVLIDRSRVGSPYLRLLLTAIGEELVKGSPWVAIEKETASRFESFLPPFNSTRRPAAA